MRLVELVVHDEDLSAVDELTFDVVEDGREGDVEQSRVRALLADCVQSPMSSLELFKLDGGAV